MRSTISIRNTTRGPVPRVPFEGIARAILGPRYELSLVVCGDSLARHMNATYRKKNYRPNVLSFPIARNEGEIFLNVRCAEREAKRYKVKLIARLALLFVHGCFHLKGLKHGAKMERAEQTILKRFKLS